MTRTSDTTNLIDHLAAIASAGVNVALLGDPDQPRPHISGIDISATRTKKPPVLPPDGLLTLAEAARKLRCSIKTLRGHIDAGDLRYVSIGKGTKRPRRMFTPADLDSFVANQTRKDVPCPPTSQKMAARRISTTTSKCEVIGFTARRNARRAAKPKK
jgi:hypothetical protein